MTTDTTDGPGTELAVITNPATGELVNLAAATDELAKARVELVKLRGLLNEFGRELDAELNRRLDRMNKRQAIVGGYGIKSKAPTETSYPVEALQRALAKLVAEDKLDAAVVAQTITRGELKVDKREVNKLLRHADPDVVEAIKAVAVESPVNRTITVEEVRSS